MLESKIEGNNNNSGVIIGNLSIHQPLKVQTLLARIVEELAEIYSQEDDEKNITIPVFNIEDKISYNNVIKYREIINELCKYWEKCESIFNSIDNNDIGAKRKILGSINFQYKTIIGDLIRENPNKEKMELIKENSDDIIDKIFLILKSRIEANNKSILAEDIDIGLPIIICYLFMKCKILEEPKNDN